LSIGFHFLTQYAGASTTQTAGATSPDGVWQETSSGAIANQKDLPPSARAVRLNRQALARMLDRAPLEFSPEAAAHPVTLLLPLPEGGFARFGIETSSVMDPALAARFPEIKSYRGQGLDDPGLSMRCDLSPRGFYVSVLSNSKLISIQPAGGGDIYASFSGGTAQEGAAECLTRDIHRINSNLTATQSAVRTASVGSSMRNYRIAIAATWEYCNQYGSGTTAGTVATINTWLNAANLVYEREMAVHLNLVNDTDVLYTTQRNFTATTDPYDNSNVNAMLNTVQSDLNTNVGVANYDIGHVLGQIAGTGGSGVAYIGVV
jgi:hypothetical protein